MTSRGSGSLSFDFHPGGDRMVRGDGQRFGFSGVSADVRVPGDLAGSCDAASQGVPGLSACRFRCQGPDSRRRRRRGGSSVVSEISGTRGDGAVASGSSDKKPPGTDDGGFCSAVSVSSELAKDVTRRFAAGLLLRWAPGRGRVRRTGDVAPGMVDRFSLATSAGRWSRTGRAHAVAPSGTPSESSRALPFAGSTSEHRRSTWTPRIRDRGCPPGRRVNSRHHPGGMSSRCPAGCLSIAGLPAVAVHGGPGTSRAAGGDLPQAPRGCGRPHPRGGGTGGGRGMVRWRGKPGTWRRRRPREPPRPDTTPRTVAAATARGSCSIRPPFLRRRFLDAVPRQTRAQPRTAELATWAGLVDGAGTGPGWGSEESRGGRTRTGSVRLQRGGFRPARLTRDGGDAASFVSFHVVPFLLGCSVAGRPRGRSWGRPPGARRGQSPPAL